VLRRVRVLRESRRMLREDRRCRRGGVRRETNEEYDATRRTTRRGETAETE
jgi:hypothetical protein